MEVFVEDPHLRRELESEVLIRRRFGPEGGRRVQLRLLDLLPAEVLGDLDAGPGDLRELPGPPKGQVSIDLGAGLELILEPLDLPRGGNGLGLDLDKVTRLRVKEIAESN